MPPAASTGVGATASTAAGTSTMPPMRPVCPPASCPWAITASTPFAAWSRACFTLPQSAMTFMPELVRLGGDGSGIAEPGDEHGHALLEGDVDPSLDLVGELLHLVARGADGREEHVDPEGPVGASAHAADLVRGDTRGCRGRRR